MFCFFLGGENIFIPLSLVHPVLQFMQAIQLRRCANIQPNVPVLRLKMLPPPGLLRTPSYQAPLTGLCFFKSAKCRSFRETGVPPRGWKVIIHFPPQKWKAGKLLFYQIYWSRTLIPTQTEGDEWWEMGRMLLGSSILPIQKNWSNVWKIICKSFLKKDDVDEITSW